MLFILLLTIPFYTRAQFNRSAIELAHENIEEYLKSKLFRNKTYTSVSYGQLKEKKDADKETAWELNHIFTIEDGRQADNRDSTSTKQEYNFTFYFDRKLNVIKAETSR